MHRLVTLQETLESWDVDMDWLDHAISAPLPIELCAINININTNSSSSSGDQHDRTKVSRLSKAMAKVWISVVQFLLDFAFKKKNMPVYFKTVQKMYDLI